MNSFKDIAYDILKEAGRSLHSKEITKIALKHEWLKTAGKTPDATMHAQLMADINSKKDKSRFVKTAPSVFGLNESVPKTIVKEAEKVATISQGVSSKQKGYIAEGRIAELITLYGDTTLACYKPISDDEGIDLIVKEKNSLRTMYIQVKSRFGNNLNKTYTANLKESGVVDNYSMAVVFCYFYTEEGDLWGYLWFVPAPDFRKLATKSDGGRSLTFVAGRKKKESNKWDDFLIEKKDLANKIIAQMKRI